MVWTYNTTAGFDSGRFSNTATESMCFNLPTDSLGLASVFSDVFTSLDLSKWTKDESSGTTITQSGSELIISRANSINHCHLQSINQLTELASLSSYADLDLISCIKKISGKNEWELMPGQFIYWKPSSWFGLQLRITSNFPYYKQIAYYCVTKSSGSTYYAYFNASIDYNVNVYLKTKVRDLGGSGIAFYFYYNTTGPSSSWTYLGTFTVVADASNFRSDAPKIMLGSGYGSEPGYPNTDLDNDFGVSHPDTYDDRFTGVTTFPFKTSGYWDTPLINVPANEKFDNITINMTNSTINDYIEKIELLDSFDVVKDTATGPFYGNSVNITSAMFTNSLIQSNYSDVRLRVHINRGNGLVDSYGMTIDEITITPISYFPLFSEYTLPEKYEPKADLYINNSLFKWWESIEIRTRINELGDITVRVPNDNGLFSNYFLNGTEISVFLGWDTDFPELYWKGEIESYTISADKKGSFIFAWGRDKAKILDDERTVDDNFDLYPNFTGTYGDLMKYLNSQLSIPLNESFTVASTDLNVVKVFGFNKSIDDFSDAATKGGYEWFYEARADALVMRPPKQLLEANIVKTYILGNLSDFIGESLNNVALLLSDSVDVDSSDKITRVRFDGVEGVSAVYPLTLPNFIREYYEQSDEWETNADALQAAINYYNTHRFDRTSLQIELPFGEDEVILGDIVKVDDSKYGISTTGVKLYKVIGITHTISKKEGWKSILELGDFTPRITDFVV